MEKPQDLVASLDPLVDFYKLWKENCPKTWSYWSSFSNYYWCNRSYSTDQKYLLEIYKAASSGRVSEDLGKRSSGRLNHARWLTTANRILRLYVLTETYKTLSRETPDYIGKLCHEGICSNVVWNKGKPLCCFWGQTYFKSNLICKATII